MAEMEGIPKESMDQAKIQLFKKLSDVRMDIENNPVPLEEYFKINPGAKRRLDAFIKNETMSGKDMSGILNNLGPRYGEYIKTAISNIQQGKPSEAPPTEQAPPQAGAQPSVPPSTLGEPQIETVDKLREKGVTFENGVMQYRGQPITPEMAHQLLGIQPETPESGYVHSLFKLQGQPETTGAIQDEFKQSTSFSAFKPTPLELVKAPQKQPQPTQPAIPPLEPVNQKAGMQETNIPPATTPLQKTSQKSEKKPPGE
jgi:hypothetical protein